MQRALPLITVIVPTYQKFTFLKDTLWSIYLQDYPSIEVFITDDGSDNYDESFVHSLAVQAPPHIRVRVLHHSQNLGTVKNLNSAIKRIEGDFLCFLGSDDILFETSTLRTLMSAVKENTMVLMGKAIRINEDGFPYKGSRFKFNKPSALFSLLPRSVLYCYMLAQGNIYSAPGTLYRRSLFTDMGLYDEQFKYIEDFPFWLFLIRKDIPIGYIPQPLVKYRLGGISTSLEGRFQKIMKRELYQVYTREYELLPRSFYGNILREFIALQIKGGLLDCDTQGIAARHLKHILLIRCLRKGLALFKGVVDIFSF